MKLLTFLKKLDEDAPQVDMSDEGRMSRAQAMGFDTSQVWYHGSPQRDLTSMDPSADKNANTVGDVEGMYFTPEQYVASGYTRPRASWGQAGKGQPKPPRGQIYSVYLRMQNPLDITDAINGRKKGVPFSDAKRAATQAVDRSKHDSIIFRGDDMNNPEAIVFDPKNVRSVDAPFVTSDSVMMMSSIGESQLDDDYSRGYNEGQIEGIKAGKEYRDSPHGREPEFENFHVQKGRVTKANGYAKAYAYGYQDGYYTMVTGGDAEHLIAKITARLNESQPTQPPRVAYHATFPDNRDNIRMHGLDPKYSDTFEEGAVFFATGGTPDPRMDIWKADLGGLDIEYDPTQEGGDREHWWYTHQLVVPDRLTLVQKGTG